jgi:Sulfotransferase domain
VTRHLLVIGGQRCGTTLLYQLLDAHPDIAMARPVRPEPKVFLSDELAGRGIDWYHATYFAHATTESLFGEKSTSYIEDPLAPARAARVLGLVAIVVQLRDPVARAVSNWRFSREHGVEERGLAEALAENLAGPRSWDPSKSSVSPYAYLERGRYVEHLEPWFAAFPAGVHVRFLEDDPGSPEQVADLYRTLGVDPTFRPPVASGRVNESRGETPSMDADLVARLRDYFRDSDARLASHLGRRLPWVTS